MYCFKPEVSLEHSLEQLLSSFMLSFLVLAGTDAQVCLEVTLPAFQLYLYRKLLVNQN